MNALKKICFILLFFCFSRSYSQNDSLLQFSGIVLTSDSLETIPYATVLMIGKGKGTITNSEGFFSFAAKKGDTIQFSAIGYKAALYIIPQNLTSKKYSVIQLLTEDTIFLAPTVVTPWPYAENFDYYFVKLEIPDDDLERARKNLEREKLKEIADAMPMDGKENQNYTMKQQQARYYYAGQLPPQKIFDPLAWAEFFRAWKNGDFKKK